MSKNKEIDPILQQLIELDGVVVSVALFGQPGAGKSSLINKMAGRRLAEVGVETDKTRTAATYRINGLDFIDLPGYGTALFPKEGYAECFGIDKIDLFLCVVSGKLHQTDTEFFQELIRRGKTCIFVVNKHDELWEDGVELAELEQRKRADIWRHVGNDVPVIFTSCRNQTGLDELQTQISRHLQGAKRERWERNARAYSKDFLARKRLACERYVSLAALAGAANGVNPVPGVDAAVDVAILVRLFGEIREAYGLTDHVMDRLQSSAIPMIARLAAEILEPVARQGALQLLKRTMGRKAALSMLRCVPAAGQVIAMGLGYAICAGAGCHYLNKCHEMAEEMLRHRLGL